MRSAYLNGQWVPDQRLSVPLGDPGFAMGVTITERLRTFAGSVWRQAEHVERLRRSAQIVGLPEEIVDELDAAITEYAQRHEPFRMAGRVEGVEDDWAIVVFATPGVGGEPTRCVHGFPLAFGGWAHQYAEGVSLRLSTHRQTPPSCWPTELKCRSRMHYYLADQEAHRLERGARALLLDQDGFIGEASTANVVVYNRAEGIVSPRMEQVLPGVSVAALRELAAASGTPFTERDLTVDEFRSAEEAWLCSTSSCLLPVTRFDGRPIGSGQPSPGYQRFLHAWNEATGVDIAEQARRHAKT